MKDLMKKNGASVFPLMQSFVTTQWPPKYTQYEIVWKYWPFSELDLWSVSV